MKILDDSVSIVLVGKWNKYILDPEWIAKNLFNEEKIQVEFPILNFDLPPRFSHENIRIVLNKDRLEFFALSYSKSVFDRIEEMIKTVTNILKHTPTGAFGINFEYNTDSNDQRLLELFEFSDNNGIIDSDESLPSITEMAITRTLELDDRKIKFTLKKTDLNISFRFNFHYVVKNADEINSKISGQFLSCKEMAEKILKNTYNQELEKGKNNEFN